MAAEREIEEVARLLNEGRARDAAELCRRIVHTASDQPRVWYLLGLAAYQLHQYVESADALTRACEGNSNSDLYHAARGQALMRLNHLDGAAASFTRALQLNPRFPAAANNLGVVLQKLGRFDEAIVAYHHALLQLPGMAEAHNNLGECHRACGRIDDAIRYVREALRLRPDYANAHYNLGNALRENRRFDEAIASYQTAISLQPDHLDAQNNLGLALQRCGRIDDAAQAFERALAIKPDCVDAHSNLGAVLQQQGKIDEGIAACRRAIELQSDHPAAHYNLGLGLLLKGEFVQGWRENGWRWRLNELGLNRPDFERPEWNGEDLHGKRILLYAEQGIGDTIQFARYLPMVIERHGRVAVGCEPELVDLLSTIPGVERFVTNADEVGEFDVHRAMMDLPAVLETTSAQKIPAVIPYLHADPSKSLYWSQRIARNSPDGTVNTSNGLKVGLTWAGRPEHRHDRVRSMPLQALAPLAQMADVNFYSLQKGPAAEQCKTSVDLKLTDWAGDLTDFSQTAALMDNLDLVITVDTSVAHLAGALGKPVWLLLQHIPDWRWMLERDDSPWYPTMRLFRQSKWEDWTTPVQRILALLRTIQSSRAAT